MPDPITQSAIESNNHVETLHEFATEVKIPINECFISLGIPPEFFKEDAARAQSLAKAQADLNGMRQFLAVQEQLPPQVFVGRLPGAPPDFAKTIVLQELNANIAAIQRAVTQLMMPRHPQLFLVETYRLTTQRTAKGKGQEVNVFNLGPGAENTFEITSSFSQSTDSTTTTTVMESQDATVSKDFNTHVANASAQSGGAEANAYHMDANFHGDASVGFGNGEANAQLGVKGGSNSVRSDFSDAVQNALDKQVVQTSASRQQSVSQAGTDAKTTTTTTTTNKTTIKNPNPTHTLNIIFSQLVEQYTSFLSLVDVQVALRTTDPTEDKQVRLPDLDTLLNDTLNTEKISEVRQVIKGELESVLDFQDAVTNIVEEVPFGPDQTILRLTKNLQTVFVLKDANGSPVRNINVDGLLLKSSSRIIASRLPPVSDLVIGESSAV